MEVPWMSWGRKADTRAGERDQDLSNGVRVNRRLSREAHFETAGLDPAAWIELSLQSGGKLTARNAFDDTLRRCAKFGRWGCACWLSAVACGRDAPLPREAAAPPLGAAVAADDQAPVREKQLAPSSNAGTASAFPLRPGGAEVVRSEHGMVVSVEPHATRAGVRVLSAGGNAIDAAVATAYALAVTHPSAGNLGGGGFMLIARPGLPIVALDFRERAPHDMDTARLERVLRAGAEGPGASAVPGSVAGLNLAEQRFGRLGLERVLAPAIELARSGYALGARQALTLRWAWPRLRQDREARRIFGSARGPLPAGSRLVQPELAITLERIARDGDAGFYSGPSAAALAAAMGALGGIDERDLSEYRAVLREPLRFDYRGYQVSTMPPPSSGGVALAQILTSLERLTAHELQQDSAEEMHLFIELSKRAQARRRFELVDPESAPDAMSPSGLAPWLGALALLERGPAIDPARATPSHAIDPLYPEAERELEHTTHLAVIDAEGNAVTCTTTLSAGFGAGYVAAGTGVVMNNSLAGFGRVGLNLPRAGRRMLSSMAPTLMSKDGRVVALLGSPGGDTIPSTIAQVLRHLVDHGMTLDEAVEAPRLHHGFIPDELRLESSRPLPAPLLAELQARGHTLRPIAAPMGAAHNIISVAGVAYGHADLREGGLALGAQPLGSGGADGARRR
jgi:gamma-glutamyltranspeptidase / glutathione hydrolase